MILAFDVGNSNIVIGVFRERTLVTQWRIRTDPQKTADEYAVLLRELFTAAGLEMAEVSDVVVSSVVPPMMTELERMIGRYLACTPLIVEPGVKTGLAIKYDNPREVGADRVVNAVAAYEKYGGQRPLIIVDFGTATTFCVVTAGGEYLGGAIAPGIGISTEALFARTAKLPRVELVRPRSVIGKNTIMSMQSGIIFGFVGQVTGIVQRMKEEIGEEALVVATGGLAPLISQEADCIDIVDPELTLDGLRLILEKNR
ncbi:MAG: type III pantothenate kinase [Syntrophomonadaceae bacterium]|jgi:type III pantothenate kinase|nr:type III pantothenate kinase [Syntrophomonadaceae bacterium]